jgi:hypothetical protein
MLVCYAALSFFNAYGSPQGQLASSSSGSSSSSDAWQVVVWVTHGLLLIVIQHIKQLVMILSSNSLAVGCSPLSAGVIHTHIPPAARVNGLQTAGLV